MAPTFPSSARNTRRAVSLFFLSLFLNSCTSQSTSPAYTHPMPIFLQFLIRISHFHHQFNHRFELTQAHGSSHTAHPLALLSSPPPLLLALPLHLSSFARFFFISLYFFWFTALFFHFFILPPPLFFFFLPHPSY